MTSFMNDPKEIRVKTAPQNFKAIDVNETAVKLQWKTNHCMKDGYTVGCSLPEGTTVQGEGKKSEYFYAIVASKRRSFEGSFLYFNLRPTTGQGPFINYIDMKDEGEVEQYVNILST